MITQRITIFINHLENRSLFDILIYHQKLLLNKNLKSIQRIILIDNHKNLLFQIFRLILVSNNNLNKKFKYLLIHYIYYLFVNLLFEILQSNSKLLFVNLLNLFRNKQLFNNLFISHVTYVDN